MERPIRYVRDNFVYGRDFVGDAHLDEETARWLEKANGRRHATTKEPPRLRFERDERPLLGPLAEGPYRLLVLPRTPEPLRRTASAPRGVLPHVAVEKRPLSAYATLIGGAA